MYIFLLFLISCGSAEKIDFNSVDESTNTSLSDFSEEQTSQNIEVDSIELTHPALTLIPNQNAQLSLKVTLSNGAVYKKIKKDFSCPYDLAATIHWFSNDTDIVTVDDDGKLIAVSAGSTTVKASLYNHSVLAEITVSNHEETVAEEQRQEQFEIEETEVENTEAEQEEAEKEDQSDQVEESEDTDDNATDSEEFIPEEPFDESDSFLNENDTLTLSLGENGGFGEDDLPDVLYGEPVNTRTDVLSLGNGGEIVIELGGYDIVDGEGNDFTVFENAFSNWTERAQIAVSEDGIEYFEFTCDAFDSEEIFSGCAGVTAVNYSSYWTDYLDSTISGGDSFDLSEVGLQKASFIKITDLATCTNAALCIANTSGFDLDAIAILNGMNSF